MSTSKPTYAIIGGGSSGLHLAMAMLDNKNLAFEQLLIFEKKLTHQNDKTWSFWENDLGKWDKICIKKWKKALFKAKGKTTSLTLSPYSYKSISSKDFYIYCEKELLKDNRIKFIKEEVTNLIETRQKLTIQTKHKTYHVNHAFDSRLPNLEEIKGSESKQVWQHFKGWFIESEEDFFDDTSFTMMDYSLKDGSSTSFTYVLPFTKRKALVEFTYFSPQFVEDSVYDNFIEKYISTELKLANYSITGTEKGIIPMTNFPFEKMHTNRVTAIGTRGGWVKASTGYSFKNAERNAAKIVQNLVNGRNSTLGLYNLKYQHYDTLFLDVLQHKNYFGEELFYRLYNKIPIQMLFRFLDEESSYAEDFRLITSLTSTEFITAFFNHAMRKFNIHR